MLSYVFLEQDSFVDLKGQAWSTCVVFCISILCSHDIKHNTQQDEDKTNQDSFICFFEFDTRLSPSHRHRLVLVHVEQFSMAFQDCHETGVREEHRTEWSSV